MECGARKLKEEFSLLFAETILILIRTEQGII
jgi:hypothetical protein